MFRDGLKQTPKMLVDCSTIGMDELAEVRKGLDKLGVKFLAAPVSGNPKCVRVRKVLLRRFGSARRLRRR